MSKSMWLWSLVFSLVVAGLLLQTVPTSALLLCAKVDRSTGELKDGSSVKLRVSCKKGKDGAPVEVPIGSTEQLSAIPSIAGRLNTISSTKPNGVTFDRFTDNGDGTATDKLTGLRWELKTDDDSIHDKDNKYDWSIGNPWKPDGTAYTVFLASLNTPPCFAGHCDWRLPTIDELQTLIEPAYPDCMFDPCTHIPGETLSGFYWSSSAASTFANVAWGVNFDVGLVLDVITEFDQSARAVRGAS